MKTAPLASRRLLFASAFLLPSVALPQSAPQSLDQIMSASSSKDESVSMLDTIVGGGFFTSPFSAVGGVDTLLGGMLLIFNGAIFLIAVLWGTYNVLRGVVGTAQDGEVLGKQISTVWMPIRMVTGIVGIVPVFGGFNLAQVVFVLVTALGIGIANLMFKGVVTMSDGFSTLLSPILSSPTSGNDYRKLAYGLFATEVCRLAKEAAEQASEAAGDQVLPADRVVRIPWASPAAANPHELALVPGTLVKYGTPNEPHLCGHATLMRRTDANVGATSVLGLALGYESPAINYGRVEQQVRAGYATAQRQLSARVRQVAQTWWAQRATSQSITASPPPPAPVAALDEAARAYAVAAQRATTQAAAGIDQGAIQSRVKDRMEAGGWITLGTWHSAFTQANSAVVDAVSTIQVDVLPPSETVSSSLMAEAFASFDRSVRQAQGNSHAAHDKAEGLGLVKHIVCDAMPAAVTDVGECSLGQLAVKAAIGALGGGSGGASAAGGMIDPIVMFKNAGDWMMTAGTALLATSWAVNASAHTVSGAADAAGSIPMVGTLAGKTVGFMAEKIAQASAYLTTYAAGMILLGGIMAVYIPLIPFITWMGGLIQYFVIFFEGLAAMTLAALSHMDSHGEGMGQRSEPGYVFLLNMLVRPGLMVLGFVAASATCVALGTLQARLFLPAIANSQGNSVTGLASFLMLVVIFMIINWVLIQGMYNMIFLLPDNVIGIIGRSGSADLGKQVEDKSYNLLLGVTRTMQRNSTALVGSMGKRSNPGADDFAKPRTAGRAAPGSGGPGTTSTP